MPVKPDLLEILCCPLTKTPLKALDDDAIRDINERIGAGQVKYESGAVVKDPLQEGLITVDGQRIYAVRDGIPVMLVDESIPTGQLGRLFGTEG
ncbi:MAG: hypothetical protein KIT09_04160 [Bryobacteraceae bacterium]|nr:hypothetical protein [Bryobacteraceae bacterium]